MQASCFSSLRFFLLWSERVLDNGAPKWGSTCLSLFPKRAEYESTILICIHACLNWDHKTNPEEKTQTELKICRFLPVTWPMELNDLCYSRRATESLMLRLMTSSPHWFHNWNLKWQTKIIIIMTAVLLRCETFRVCSGAMSPNFLLTNHDGNILPTSSDRLWSNHNLLSQHFIAVCGFHTKNQINDLKNVVEAKYFNCLILHSNHILFNSALIKTWFGKILKL